MTDTTILKPGQQIKPKIDEKCAINLVEKIYGLRVTKIRELIAYDDQNYHVHCENDHRNPHVKEINEHGYVLKILNWLDSRDTSFVEGQNEMMIYLDRRDVTCPVPVKTLRGHSYAVETSETRPNEGNVIRLLVYRPGSTLQTIPITAKLLRDVGRFAARLDAILDGFFHPAYENRSTVWMLAETPRLRDFVFAVNDPNDRRMVTQVIDDFEKQVVAIVNRLDRGIIHGDLNEQNLLADPETETVMAVIDFGDSHKSCRIFELAIVVCYMIVETRDLKMAKPVIEGFQTVKKLDNVEKKILKICVCARLCQSLTLGVYSHMNDPKNDYVLVTQKSGWDVLRELWPLDNRRVFDIWGLDDAVD